MPVHPKRKANAGAKCPKVKDPELRAMVEAAWAAGWWCEKRANGHVMCYPPDKAARMVLVANTPSDHRTVPNTRSSFRRSGLNL